MQSRKTQLKYQPTKSRAVVGAPIASSVSKKTESSGTLSFLSYPKIQKIGDIPEIKEQLVYIISPYKEDGFSVLFYTEKDQIRTSIGNWDGKAIDVGDLANDDLGRAVSKFIQEWMVSVSCMLELIKVKQCQLYFSVDGNNVRLVDIRRSLNNFCSPGMVRDLFSKVVPTQEVKKIDLLDLEMEAAIDRGEGTYQGNLIIKSSTFKTVMRDRNVFPLYAKVIR